MKMGNFVCANLQAFKLLLRSLAISRKDLLDVPMLGGWKKTYQMVSFFMVMNPMVDRIRQTSPQKTTTKSTKTYTNKNKSKLKICIFFLRSKK